MTGRNRRDFEHKDVPNLAASTSAAPQNPLQTGFGTKRGTRISIVAGLAMAVVMLGLAGRQIWQVARALPDLRDYQAAFRDGDGIVLASQRQQIDRAMRAQDWPRASKLLTQLKRVYPNDVNVLLQDVRVRILMLPNVVASRDEQAKRRAELTDALRVIMTLAGKDEAVRQKVEMLLAAMMMQVRPRFDDDELPTRP
jgi:hypothetical protein